MADDYMQRYIYGSSSYNYFYIITDTIHADGYYRYLRLKDVNYVFTSYPSYRLIGKDYYFSNYSRNINVSFAASKYLSANISDGTFYTFDVTFTAGGGDVYRGSYI